MGLLFNKVTRVAYSLLFIQLLCAWTVGGANTDSTANIGSVKSCTTTVAPISTGGYDKDTAPSECHRWGLKWSIHGADKKPSNVNDLGEPDDTREDDWILTLLLSDPDSDGEPRLPTIKELVRIFEYNKDERSPAGVPTTDQVFRAWLQEDANINPLTGYLVSSTYRHINNGEIDSVSGDNGKRVRLLAVEIGTGKVVALDGTHRVCESLSTTATCTYPATDANVYAFFVGSL